MSLTKTDLYVDLLFGLLLLVGMGAMLGTDRYLPAVTFGFGVFLAYAIHIAWRMALFDTDETVEMSDVEETVEEAVEETVEDVVNDS